MVKIEKMKDDLNLIKSKLYDINLNRPLNVFDVTLISSRETSHSAFLAWLLNPKENHKLNDLFLKEFLDELEIDQRYELKEVDVDTEIATKNRRIDIIIELGSQKICIENKIEDYPTIKQISDEIDLFKPTTMVLLAPEVTLKSFKEEAKEISGLKFISYNQIHKIVNKIKNNAPEKVKFFLVQYTNNLEVNIMTNKLHNFNEKSRLYVEHCDEVDEIIDEFKEERKTIWDAFLNRLKQKYPHFKHNQYYHGNGIALKKENWKKDKEFDVSIDIELYPDDVKKNKTSFYICFTKSTYPKIKMIRAKFKKISHNSLIGIDYKFADETYYLYKKTINVEQNYVDTLYNEFSKLIDLGIVELIEKSINNC